MPWSKPRANHLKGLFSRKYKPMGSIFLCILYLSHHPSGERKPTNPTAPVVQVQHSTLQKYGAGICKHIVQVQHCKHNYSFHQPHPIFPIPLRPPILPTPLPLQAALTAVAQRFPDLQLAIPREFVRHLPLDSISALEALPLRSVLSKRCPSPCPLLQVL